MSKIAQLVANNRLEHDIKFNNSGPITGIVDGVQSITIVAPLTLSFGVETGKTQIHAAFLAIDSGATARVVKLPAALTVTNNNVTETVYSLVGREIKIFNAGTASLKIENSAGGHITTIWAGQIATVLSPSQSLPTVNSGALKKSSVTLNKTQIDSLHSTAIVIVDVPATAAVVVSHVKSTHTRAGSAYTFTGTVQINVSGITVALPSAALTGASGTSAVQSAVQSQVPVLGANMTVDLSGAAGGSPGATQQLVVEVYYYEV
tara:strand:+ start:18171 stop:18956 length:786 start_codon:yes stop_codon:yes gene_type:complete